jgi:protein-disulfide isomerase
LLEKYSNKLKLVFKYLPAEGHQYSFLAAASALAAFKQNQFWEYHRKLFENFDTLDDKKMSFLAAELGLNLEQFDKDRYSSQIQTLIERDVNDAVKLDLIGIPTVYINGKKIKNRSMETFTRLIDAELKKR